MKMFCGGKWDFSESHAKINFVKVTIYNRASGFRAFMICGTSLDLLQNSGEYPCAVCRTGVGKNSIYCNGCKLWVHKKCSGLRRLTPNPDCRCAWCIGNARPIEGRPQNEVQDGPDKLEVVASFCYLGDMLSAGGGCEITVTTRV